MQLYIQYKKETAYLPFLPLSFENQRQRKEAHAYSVKIGAPGLQIYGGPGSLSHEYKIWRISKAVGQVDPSFLVVKKSHFNKKYKSYSESIDSTKLLSIQ